MAVRRNLERGQTWLRSYITFGHSTVNVTNSQTSGYRRSMAIKAPEIFSIESNESDFGCKQPFHSSNLENIHRIGFIIGIILGLRIHCFGLQRRGGWAKRRRNGNRWWKSFKDVPQTLLANLQIKKQQQINQHKKIAVLFIKSSYWFTKFPGWGLFWRKRNIQDVLIFFPALCPLWEKIQSVPPLSHTCSEDRPLALWSATSNFSAKERWTEITFLSFYNDVLVGSTKHHHCNIHWCQSVYQKKQH